MKSKRTKFAFIAHSEMEALLRFQSALSAKGFTVVVARDIATALLAMNHHCFDLSIVSADFKGSGDGWPLAAVLRMAFPKATVCVLTPSEPDVLTLQSAINYGIRQTYELSLPPQEVISSLLSAK
ncbi:MAG: hypothetical protein NVSMB58_32300 [Terriglobales bacterium]